MREIETEIEFSTGARTPWQWNPETGERTPYFFSGRKNRLSVRVERCGSLLLVFEPGMEKPASPAGAHAFLNLGPVNGISSVILNGHILGLKWYGCHRYATGDILVAGENRLEVQITTVLGNYMKPLTGNPVARTWTARQPLYPAGLSGPVRLLASA